MGPVIQDYKKLFQEMKTEKLIVQNTKADVGKIDYLPLVNIDSEIDENKKNFLLRVLVNTKISLQHNYQTYAHYFANLILIQFQIVTVLTIRK